MNHTSTRPIDLSGRLDDPAVREIISYAVGYPTPEKLDAIMRLHRSGERDLVGIERDGQVVACLSYEGVSKTRIVIQHIAVSPDERRGGLGRALVKWLQDTNPGSELQADTDSDAIDFYRRCGFSVARFVDPRWPEVERWRCTLAARAEARAQ